MGLLSRLSQLNEQFETFNNNVDNAAAALRSAGESGRFFQENVDVPDFDMGSASGQGGTAAEGPMFGSGGPIQSGGTQDRTAAGATQDRAGTGLTTVATGTQAPTISNYGFDPFQQTSYVGQFDPFQDQGGGAGGRSGGGANVGSFDTSGLPEWWSVAPDFVKSSAAANIRHYGFLYIPGLPPNVRSWIDEWTVANAGRMGTGGGGGSGAGFASGGGGSGGGTTMYAGHSGYSGPPIISNTSQPQDMTAAAFQDLGRLQQDTSRTAEQQRDQMIRALEAILRGGDNGTMNRAQGLI